VTPIPSLTLSKQTFKLLTPNCACGDKSKITIIDSGITKQKDIKLVIQMKCNLEL
jgi:hypothetical protein